MSNVLFQRPRVAVATCHIHMEAWLESGAAPKAAGKARGATSLNYARFDAIVDSDDEEDEKRKEQERRKALTQKDKGGSPLDSCPPHLKRAYAKVAMAQVRTQLLRTRSAYA